MHEQKSWDPYLVKKFGSTNHFKLLNQLRNEVKKYPLIRKKNISVNNNVVNNKKSTNDLSKCIPEGLSSIKLPS